ncbi:MAG: hypothetical protein ABID54_13680 [Pseudomonadota bacterium]
MLTISKWLFIVGGALFIIDSILLFAGVRTLFFGWPLPCPVTLLLVGVGILLFGIGSAAFKKE